MSRTSIFFLHFIQKAHLVCSRLCGWVFACVYQHRWVWSRSRFGVLFQRPFSWFQTSLFWWCVWPCDAPEWTMQPPPQPLPPIFTIHLCVDAAVKSTNTLINHTSKSNVKPLLREKNVFSPFLSTKDFKKRWKYIVPEMHVLCACHTVGYQSSSGHKWFKIKKKKKD